MGCEVVSTGGQPTTTGRPALLRIQASAGTAEVGRLTAGALEAGFDGVELALHSRAGLAAEDQVAWRLAPSEPTTGRTVPIGALAAVCRATDIEAAVPELVVLLQKAVAAGARCLNLSIPPVGQEAGSGGFPSYQYGLNFAYGLLRGIRLEAEGAGVVVALEGACGGCLLSPVELREIIDCASSSAIGACIDVQRIATFSSPADWIRTLRSRVQAVRTSEPEAERGGRSDEVRTTLDTSVIAEALDSIGYAGVLIASSSGRPDVARSLLATLGCPVVAPQAVQE